MSYQHRHAAPTTTASSMGMSSSGAVTSGSTGSSSDYDCHPDKCMMESSTTVDSGFLSSGICTTESDLSVTSACDLGAAPTSSSSSHYHHIPNMMPTSPSSSSVNFSGNNSCSNNKSMMMSKSYCRLDSGVDVSDNLSQLNLSESQDAIVMKSSMMSSGILSEKEEDSMMTSGGAVGGVSGDSQNQPMMMFKSLDEFPPWEYFFTPDEDGDTQLHVAVMQGYTEAVCSLISLVPHPSVLDFQNDLCQTALHVAILANQPKLARRLVAAGARVDMRDRNGNTPMHLACMQGDLESLQALTTALNVVETTQIQLKYPSFAQALPQQIDLPNYDGQAPIHLAAVGGHCDVIRALHWLGTDLNAKDGKGGRTALHYAVERGHVSAITCLVGECGVNTELETYGGLTAYQMASESACTNCKEMVKELTRLGAVQLTVPMDEDEDDEDDPSEDEGEAPC